MSRSASSWDDAYRIDRIALQAGNDDRMLEATQVLFEARRPLLGSDLLSMQLMLSADSNEYALISVWASAEADAVHENDAAERDAARALVRLSPVRHPSSGARL